MTSGTLQLISKKLTSLSKDTFDFFAGSAIVGLVVLMVLAILVTATWPFWTILLGAWVIFK